MSGRRSQARRYAVLALYQWQITGLAPAEIVRHFFDDPAWMQVVAESLGLAKGERQSVADALYDMSLFQDLLRGVPEQLEDLDRRLETVLALGASTIVFPRPILAVRVRSRALT